MNSTSLFCILFWLTPNCANLPNKHPPSISNKYEHMQLDPKTLIEHVKLAINPKYPHWVLFSNGTYIIIGDLTIKDEAAFAIKIMKEYGPVHIGSPDGDFGVKHLNKTEGWVVSGNYSAMYTYVDPEELKQAGIKNPSDIDIGLFGRNKRDKDGKECKIIFISK